MVFTRELLSLLITGIWLVLVEGPSSWLASQPLWFTPFTSAFVKAYQRRERERVSMSFCSLYLNNCSEHCECTSPSVAPSQKLTSHLIFFNIHTTSRCGACLSGLVSLHGMSLEFFPLKKKKGNIVELKNKTPIKALPLFSECSREFGYRNMGGTKILL